MIGQRTVSVMPRATCGVVAVEAWQDLSQRLWSSLRSVYITMNMANALS